MKAIYKLIIVSLTLLIIATSCKDESDLAFTKVVAPVVVQIEDSAVDEISVTFTELDKSGILNKDIGIVSIPVPDLSVEVFAKGTSLGIFTTNLDGIINVPYTGEKPNEFAGLYKGTAFRIIK